jgi:homocitrate synthase NifV
LKHACAIDLGIDTHRFVELSRFVAKASRRPLPEWKPVVGKNVFSHESGLHADGVIKNPANYEGFDPSEVGLQRRLVVGKHSGTSGVMERYREMGITVSRREAQSLMDHVRSTAQQVKRSLNDADLLRVYRSAGLRNAA